MIIISGGGGTGKLARALTAHTRNAAYIIGGTDDGGHTRYVRQFFPQLPGLGDWRARCLDLADDNPVAVLAKHRFSADTPPSDLDEELSSIAAGRHPLVQAVNNRRKNAEIRETIGHFNQQRLAVQAERGAIFPLQNGSLGNILLAGEILRHEGVQPGLSRFADLVGARGRVVPATLGNYHLQTEMDDDRILTGQVCFSAKDPEYLVGNTVRVRDIRYCTFDYNETGQPVKVRPAIPELNPEVREALAEANAIVFAMGSFYMSILSVLKIPGFGACVRESQAPKIMIGNPTYEPETFGLTVAQMARTLIKYLKSSDPSPGNDSDYLNHLLFHDNPTRGHRRIPLGRRSLLGSLGVEVQTLPLLGADGKYDPALLAQKLVSLAA